MELPARLAAFGITTLEICHFHLPDLDTGYLSELRSALQAANIELFSLLIDEGDLTHPDHAERDLAWIGRWLEIAEHLGARRARVIAGKSTSEGAQQRSVRLSATGRTSRGIGLASDDRKLVRFPLQSTSHSHTFRAIRAACWPLPGFWQLERT